MHPNPSIHVCSLYGHTRSADPFALQIVTQVAFNDDADGLGLGSRVTFTAEANASYFVVIEPYADPATCGLTTVNFSAGESCITLQSSPGCECLMIRFLIFTPSELSLQKEILPWSRLFEGLTLDSKPF